MTTYTYRKDRTDIDWTQVTRLLNGFGLTRFTPAETEKAFSNSAVNVFILDGGKVIGCGRALSDGISQAAIYNIAVDEAYHGQGLGKKLIALILEETADCNVILYTHPDTVTWYEEQGFRRMKTGLALYHPDKLAAITRMGFI
ncbi:GNAT family N-acetyltransferase [Paenibacillus sp. MMS20-IR301]|uniref:GNAT family N-acetyltransferase n=1 Tax=Paenibacillus sp. MMS20-IR301 TaxID=2895946 RepID=UPI0028E9549E|nr:GNAT family N-acetyltransferase [Paenibacillus sp. MMS20-IR301]WNS43684.1 GNAT family N-acetyltransferase [Paenibacillus sp. MMS20-IR301]